MRNLIFALAMLGATPAMAADWVQEAEERAVYDWSGFYVGLSGGYAWTAEEYKASGETVDLRGTGWTAGAHAGYNLQLARLFVVGLEGSGAWADIGDDVTIDRVDVSSQIDWLAFAGGRAGLAFDRILAYGSAGYAGADLSLSGKAQCQGCEAADGHWANGWYWGGGVEYAVANPLTVGIDVKRVMWDNQTFSDHIHNQPINVDGNLDGWVVQGRASLKF